MTFRLPALALASVLALAAATPAARAAESLDGCNGFIDTVPAVVSTAGIWCLRTNLAFAGTSGAAITVTGNHATIACNGYRLRGASAPGATTAVGIFASNRQNVRVRNCHVAGFATGISLIGAGHEVTDSHVEVMATLGIHMHANPGLIRGNRVNDVGWWSAQANARGISAIGDVDIVDNGVDRVRGASASARVVAIRSQVGQSNVISGNRVTAVTNTLAGGTTGIHAGAGNGGSRTVVRGNTLLASAGSAGIGLVCGGTTVLTTDNQVGGWATGVSPVCASHGDAVTP